MGCSEHYYLKGFVRFLQTLHQVRSQVDAGADCLFAWEVDLENHIRVLSLDVIDTVNESLVHIEDQDLLILGIHGIWQEDQLVLDELLVNYGEVVPDELQCSQCVLEVLPVEVYLRTLVTIVLLIVLRDSGRVLIKRVAARLLLAFLSASRVLESRHLVLVFVVLVL